MRRLAIAMLAALAVVTAGAVAGITLLGSTAYAQGDDTSDPAPDSTVVTTTDGAADDPSDDRYVWAAPMVGSDPPGGAFVVPESENLVVPPDERLFIA